MQSVSSRIWTRVAVFISYGDKHYTTGTPKYIYIYIYIYIPGPATNHCPENGFNHMCIIECPKTITSFLPLSSGEFTLTSNSTFYATESRLISLKLKDFDMVPPTGSEPMQGNPNGFGTKLDLTGWERLFFGNCANKCHLTIQINGICANQNLCSRTPPPKKERIEKKSTFLSEFKKFQR